MTEPNELLTETPDNDLPADIAGPTREPSAYEKKLRAEARQHRLRAVEAERLRDEAVLAARQEGEQKLAALQTKTNERLVRAELKAHAIKAGIVDLDGLQLLDVSGVKFNDAGEVEGAEALIGKLRTAKPWLFGQGSSSSGAKAPAEQDVKFKHAKEMSLDEWKNARAEILRRR
jgi:hypothetical protein